MSKRNGDRARSNRQQTHKVLNRQRSRGLGKVSQQAVTSSAAQDGNNNVSSRLRVSRVNGQAEPSVLEIVVSHSSSGGRND
jgi:hypothetical protein